MRSISIKRCIKLYAPHATTLLLTSLSLSHAFVVLPQTKRIYTPPFLNMQIWYDCRNTNKAESYEDRGIQTKEEPDAILTTNLNATLTMSNKLPILLLENIKSGIVRDSKTSKVVGTIVNIEDASGQEQAMAALGSVEWIIVECSSTTNESWKMIPAENLIAAAQASGTQLAFCVDKSSDVGGLSRALELGVDALCVDATAATSELWEEVFEARKERELNDSGNKNESPGKTSQAVPTIVMGHCWRRFTKGTIIADRVCVDLVQTLLPEEGCWVGSSAKTLTLVLSEAAISQYVPSRPFRINAGPVHSYILLSDQTTKYLCELEPADQVEVYNSVTGKSRGVAVGRLKQEVRPCVLIELELKDEAYSQSGQIFLQQAETVRLGEEGGNFLRVTDLEAQSKKDADCMKSVLLRVTTTGTHVGKAYSGSVEEK